MIDLLQRMCQHIAQLNHVSYRVCAALSTALRTHMQTQNSTYNVVHPSYTHMLNNAKLYLFVVLLHLVWTGRACQHWHLKIQQMSGWRIQAWCGEERYSLPVLRNLQKLYTQKILRKVLCLVQENAGAQPSVNLQHKKETNQDIYLCVQSLYQSRCTCLVCVSLVLK